jgi:hypothetical protein
VIKKSEELLKFEDELKRKTKVNVKKNFQIVEAMYDEAVALGVMPPKSKLDGVEIDIKIAKVVNSV